MSKSKLVSTYRISMFNATLSGEARYLVIVMTDPWRPRRATPAVAFAQAVLCSLQCFVGGRLDLEIRQVHISKYSRYVILRRFRCLISLSPTYWLKDNHVMPVIHIVLSIYFESNGKHWPIFWGGTMWYCHLCWSTSDLSLYDIISVWELVVSVWDLELLLLNGFSPWGSQRQQTQSNQVAGCCWRTCSNLWHHSQTSNPKRSRNIMNMPCTGSFWSLWHSSPINRVARRRLCDSRLCNVGKALPCDHLKFRCFSPMAKTLALQTTSKS